MRNPVCWLIRQRLGAFQDGEVGPAARARTSAHLARCPACAGELAVLARLRAVLASRLPEPPEAVWDVFWPQVRARIAAAPDEGTATRRAWLPWVRTWGPWRLALGSALAASLAALVVLAPWQREPERPDAARVAGTVLPADPSKAGFPPTRAVVVQSVETADPQSSVMIFTNPESEVTVVWVFGLEATGTDI
jgi:anti-sigma factor RsiW